MPTSTRLPAAGALFALIVMVDSSFARAMLAPSCGTLVGRVEAGIPPVGGALVVLRSGNMADSVRTDAHGDFLLRVPGPSPTLSVVGSAGADSTLLESLDAHVGYSITARIDDGAWRDGSVRLERTTVRPLPCRGPSPAPAP